jgi:hypothetical protein
VAALICSTPTIAAEPAPATAPESEPAPPDSRDPDAVAVNEALPKVAGWFVIAPAESDKFELAPLSFDVTVIVDPETVAVTGEDVFEFKTAATAEVREAEVLFCP